MFLAKSLAHLLKFDRLFKFPKCILTSKESKVKDKGQSYWEDYARNWILDAVLSVNGPKGAFTFAIFGENVRGSDTAYS